MRFSTLFVSLLVLVLEIATASAQRDPRGNAPASASSPNEVAQPGEPAYEDDLTLETATPDPSPPVPRLLQRGHEPYLDVIEQAGVGGPTAYASQGVLEVGGTGALMANRDFVRLSFAPFVGWFVFDGIQLAYINEIYGGSYGGERDFGTLALIEISAHLRFGDRVLGFIGVGQGVLYNGDFGYAVKPRAGLDVLVGRSGIFRPAFYYTWASEDLVTPNDTPPTHWVYGLEIAYAAMF